MKKQKGITLIALIITIIVMLILVGVTVSISLNGGLFTTAKQAANKTQLELDKEQLLELALGAMNKTGEITPSEITKHGTFTFADGVYTSKSGNKFTVSKWGSVTEKQSVAIVPKKETYTIGEEVTIGNESFFVIADDTEKVTLLAKYNLNTAGTAQDTEGNNNPCAFSTTPYWTGDDADLNDNATPDGAMAKAKAYGTALGGTGGLMTYKEASTLATAHSGIINVTNIQYWLGSAFNESVVIVAYDESGAIGMFGPGFGGESYELDRFYGVRPVVTILKSVF